MLEQGCAAIGDAYAYFVAGWAGPRQGGEVERFRRDLQGVVGMALGGQGALEAGVWQASGAQGGGEHLFGAPVGELRAALDPALAAEVSNQLKNALNVIRGYAELALTGQSEERRERALHLAIDLSDQAAELVDSLQPAGGQFPHEPLPLATGPEGCELVEEPTAPAVAAKKSKGLILVVDDDAFMRQLLIDMLDDAGYQTAGANDGCQALEFMQTTRPALVFVDLAMPRMTGVDVLRETKKTAPDLPVVLMTGYAYNLAMEALGDEKPYAVIGKPFAIAEVLALAKSVVGEGRK